MAGATKEGEGTGSKMYGKREVQISTLLFFGATKTDDDNDTIILRFSSIHG